MRRAVVCVLMALVIAGCSGRGGEPRFAREFESENVPDAFSRASGALMFPGTTRAFHVDEQGDLENGAWRVTFAPAVDGVPAKPPKRIAALERWQPLLHWKRRCPNVDFDFEAVAFAADPPADTALVVSLVARAHNWGGAAHRITLRVALAPPDSNAAFTAWDAPDAPAPRRWAWPGSRDTACAWADTRVDGDTLVLDWTLASCTSRTARLQLPAYPTTAPALERLARTPHARRVEQTLAQWNDRVEAGASWEIPEGDLAGALRAANVVLLACRERRGAVMLPIGGPFQYRDVWMRDGARLVQALALGGHVEDARALVAGLATLQLPNGAFVTQHGQLDGTGQFLWVLGEVLGRARPEPGDDALIASGLRGWHWIEAQRDPALRANERFGRMLPFADPHDGELVRAQLVGDDAWSIAGERSLAKLLRARRRAAEGDSVAASAARYAADFADALARSGARDVPPSWQGVGRDWGNLAVGWPCAALPPDDPRLARAAARAQAASGASGLVSYGQRDSLHGYLGADLGAWAQRAGDDSTFEHALAALLEWRDATGAGAEIFTPAGDFGRNLPPHPTTAAALVALVRNAIIDDDGDTLRLAHAPPAGWWSGTRLRRAPTRWGPIDLVFFTDGQLVRWDWSPVPVWTELTLPRGKRLASPLDPKLHASDGGTRILVPPGTGRVHVQVAEAAAR